MNESSELNDTEMSLYVDVSHIYGKERPLQRTLRSMENGKMKVRYSKFEKFPPLLGDAPLDMEDRLLDFYAKNISVSSCYHLTALTTTDKPKVALGNPKFSLHMGLFLMGTIWIREHNRVCDILVKEHPE